MPRGITSYLPNFRSTKIEAPVKRRGSLTQFTQNRNNKTKKEQAAAANHITARADDSNPATIRKPLTQITQEVNSRTRVGGQTLIHNDHGEEKEGSAGDNTSKLNPRNPTSHNLRPNPEEVSNKPSSLKTPRPPPGRPNKRNSQNGPNHPSVNQESVALSSAAYPLAPTLEQRGGRKEVATQTKCSIFIEDSPTSEEEEREISIESGIKLHELEDNFELEDLQSDIHQFSPESQKKFKDVLFEFQKEVGGLISVVEASNAIYLQQSENIGIEAIGKEFENTKMTDDKIIQNLTSLFQQYKKSFVNRVQALKEQINLLEFESEFLTQCLGNNSYWNSFSLRYCSLGKRYGIEFRFWELQTVMQEKKLALEQEEKLLKMDQGAVNELEALKKDQNSPGDTQEQLSKQEASALLPVRGKGQTNESMSEKNNHEMIFDPTKEQGFTTSEIAQAKDLTESFVVLKEVITICNEVFARHQFFSNLTPRNYTKYHEHVLNSLKTKINSLNENIKQLDQKLSQGNSEDNSQEANFLQLQQIRLELVTRLEKIKVREKEIENLLLERKKLLQIEEEQIAEGLSIEEIKPLTEVAGETLWLNKQIVSLKENLVLSKSWDKKNSFEEKRKEWEEVEGQVKTLGKRKEIFIKKTLPERSLQIDQAIKLYSLWIQVIELGTQSIERDLKILASKNNERLNWKVQSQIQYLET